MLGLGLGLGAGLGLGSGLGLGLGLGTRVLAHAARGAFGTSFAKRAGVLAWLIRGTHEAILAVALDLGAVSSAETIPITDILRAIILP